MDFTREVGAVNRALFSLVNYQRFASEAGPFARSLFERLGAAGTVARTEVMIDLVEPMNDNDDPFRFAWDQLQTDRMYRFIRGNGERFLHEMLATGMSPLALLTYNVEWLGRGGRRNAPPRNNDEWAEFAATVVETMLDSIDRRSHDAAADSVAAYPSAQRLAVEVWNEPSPGGPYWTGTREDYFDLFRTVADRLDRDYPGVRVGGPAVLSSDGAFMLDFIEACGDTADFFTMHFYNQHPVRMARRISDWSRFIETQTGRRGALHVTESDCWNLTGLAKIDYLLTRQFELVARSDQLGSFHHFSLPYYRDGAGRVFGLLRADGRPIEHNYLPYLLFSEFRGMQVAAHVDVDGALVVAEGDHRDPLPAYVVAAVEGSTMSATAYVRSPRIARANLRLVIPDEAATWTLRVDQTTTSPDAGSANATEGDAAAVSSSPRLATTLFRLVTVEGDGDGERTVAVPIDLSHGRALRVSLRTPEAGGIDVAMNAADETVSVLNDAAATVMGNLQIVGLPSQTRVEPAGRVTVAAGERVDVVIDSGSFAALPADDTHVYAAFVSDQPDSRTDIDSPGTVRSVPVARPQ